MQKKGLGSRVYGLEGSGGRRTISPIFRGRKAKGRADADEREELCKSNFRSPGKAGILPSGTNEFN